LQRLFGHYPEAALRVPVYFRGNILAKKGMQQLGRHIFLWLTLFAVYGMVEKPNLEP
jgi:hypothetical protein